MLSASAIPWKRSPECSRDLDACRRPAPNAPQPRAAIAFTPGAPRPLRLKAVGSFVPRLTRKAFEKWLSAATLITDWPAIAGRELAAFTAPERLKWPRGVECSDDAADGADKGRPGATLLLRVDGARALDVQYNARQIIERINAYFGYAAIAELRILQAPVTAPHQDRGRPRPSPTPLTTEVAGITDAGLRDALARLGAGIRRNASPRVTNLSFYAAYLPAEAGRGSSRQREQPPAICLFQRKPMLFAWILLACP